MATSPSSQIRYQYKRRREKPEKIMWSTAKFRANKFGWDFDITPEDIVIPEYCPVLSVKLEIAEGKQDYNSPSLDRVDTTRGYTKDNIRVICWRANRLKSDATPEELHMLAKDFYLHNRTELDF